jgi:hypothetical protein
MKITYALLAGILLVMLSVNLVAADVAVGPVDVIADPTVDPPKICVFQRNVIPDGINNCDARFGQYAFAGETIYFEMVVRDYLGAENIGFVKLLVDGNEEVLCNEIPFFLPGSGEPVPPVPYIDYCNGLERTNPGTDRIFKCELTVEPTWMDELELEMVVYDVNGAETSGNHKETWFFNPGISISVETSDEGPVMFEEGGPGDCVYSTNRIQIRNTGDGGVNLWIYLAGTDLYGEGAAKCPVTNKIDIDNMRFRSWSGTQQPGQYPYDDPQFDIWVPMGEYDENAPCDAACWFFNHGPAVTCYGGKPIPGWAPYDNILTNGGLMEVEFKLCYPIPCIGQFSNGQLFVFGKAI